MVFQCNNSTIVQALQTDDPECQFFGLNMASCRMSLKEGSDELVDAIVGANLLKRLDLKVLTWFYLIGTIILSCLDAHRKKLGAHSAR